MNHLADAVRDERLARGWSIRHAVNESGNIISNTWWAKFEDRQQPLTDSIRLAVGAAFGWGTDWPERVSHPTELEQLVDRLGRLEERFERHVSAFEVALRTGIEKSAAVRERIDRLERLAERAGGEGP